MDHLNMTTDALNQQTTTNTTGMVNNQFGGYNVLLGQLALTVTSRQGKVSDLGTVKQFDINDAARFLWAETLNKPCKVLLVPNKDSIIADDDGFDIDGDEAFFNEDYTKEETSEDDAELSDDLIIEEDEKNEAPFAKFDLYLMTDLGEKIKTGANIGLFANTPKHIKLYNLFFKKIGDNGAFVQCKRAHEVKGNFTV